MLITDLTCALLRGGRCNTWGCSFSIVAFVFLVAVWHLFDFEGTVAEHGWPKALRRFWPIWVIVVCAVLAVLAYELSHR